MFVTLTTTHLPGTDLDYLLQKYPDKTQSFALARPAITNTTPSQAYNVLWLSLAADAHRHRDHCFTWTRANFIDRTSKITQRDPYRLDISGIGEEQSTFGHPSRVALLEVAS